VPGGIEPAPLETPGSLRFWSPPWRGGVWSGHAIYRNREKAKEGGSQSGRHLGKKSGLPPEKLKIKNGHPGAAPSYPVT